MIARNERNKASGEWLLDVMRWEKTGENSAHCSGEAVRCVGWGEANKVARRWMMRGAGFYVSISIADSPREPFVDRRKQHQYEPDALCMTGYAAVTGLMSGPIDAPEYIAAGAFGRYGGGGKWEQSIASRGYWR